MEQSGNNRVGIRRKLTLLRQFKDKKKSRGCHSPSQPFFENDLDSCNSIEDEARDYDSLTDLKYKMAKSNLSSSFPGSYPTFDERDEIDDMLGCNCALSPMFMREVQNDHISSPQEKMAFSSISTFHVRISIGHMTGLKIDEIVKRTKPSTNNQIIVGFVEVLSSGKYSALSQPILTNVEDTAKTRTILWANKHDGEEVSISKSRRRLHFSLSLSRETSEYEDSDYSDDDSTYSHMPEIVKLLVGLKCGDERLPLGIAKFVVNGKEASEQSIDLIVLPASDTAGSKSKRGIFGKKQRSSFSYGNLSYTLAKNAKLSVKADVKIAYPGQNGAEIWGDDDCSHAPATKPALDSGGTFSSGHTSQIPPSLTFTKIKVPPLKKKGSIGLLNTSSRKQSQKTENKSSSVRTDFCISKMEKELDLNKVPMRYVSIDANNEMVSVTSDISSRPGGCATSWACAPLFCGGCATGLSTAKYSGSYDGDLLSQSDEIADNEVDSFNDEYRSINLSGESSWGTP
eukprot:CAMPEP_0116085506 /NCGR_PEP_ID=MMETSP0327-20121206/4360_1 /TAXON_ID=44447 /ORGANISM="Pseudo-nitzschia delicatissima, Strain B596" /LENGTH=512 /DNA_ID=CAMNT_0003576499 /DNA_START=89 /DNA_END=1627 /DNA_ORIENTATION=+